VAAWKDEERTERTPVILASPVGCTRGQEGPQDSAVPPGKEQDRTFYILENPSAGGTGLYWTGSGSDIKGTVSRDFGIFLMDIHRKNIVSRSTANIF
jgi:hypothetical protein